MMLWAEYEQAEKRAERLWDGWVESMAKLNKIKAHTAAGARLRAAENRAWRARLLYDQQRQKCHQLLGEAEVETRLAMLPINQWCRR